MAIAVLPRIVQGRVHGQFRLVRLPFHSHLHATDLDQLDAVKGVVVGAALSLALWMAIFNALI